MYPKTLLVRFFISFWFEISFNPGPNFLLHLTQLYIFWNRHICSQRLPDWRKWGWKGEMLNSGCLIDYSLTAWEKESDDMSSTNGKKPEVLMKTIWSEIFQRIWEGILSGIFAWLCWWG